MVISNKITIFVVSNLKSHKMTKLNDLQRLNEVLEPFDPAYISDKGYKVPEISSHEKCFLRKVSILESKLRRKGVKYEWLSEHECFRVRRYRESEYPTYRYVRVNMDENDYSFGTWDEDLVFDDKVSVVVDAVAAWVNSKMIRK